MTTARTNYTPEQTEQLLALYTEFGNDGLETIAEKLNKTVKSIRAKLVREQVYVAPDKSAARKKEGLSKKEQLMELRKILPFETDGLMGATKEVLGELIQYLSKANN